jgi:DNA-binding transcriptional regulator YiaG
VRNRYDTGNNSHQKVKEHDTVNIHQNRTIKTEQSNRINRRNGTMTTQQYNNGSEPTDATLQAYRESLGLNQTELAVYLTLLPAD